MTSSYTTNISLEKPANGDYNNTWNVPVNSDWDIIDQAIGGRTTFNVVLASGTVSLAASEYRSRILIFSGVLSANVNYQLPAGVGGFWYVFNNTTNGVGGPYTLTISSATGSGTSYVVAQGYTSPVVCDGTNVGFGVTAPVPLATSATSATTATTATNATNAANVVTTNFTILQTGSYLYIKNGSTNICRIDSSGNALFLGNVTAYNGTIA